MTDVSEALTASIIRTIAPMMEGIRTSETSVNFYPTTWRNIPEDSHFHIRRHQNLKSNQHPEVYIISESLKCLRL
jgi:hypothetical protein